MNKRALIERWIFVCKPVQRQTMYDMLSTLTETELRRIFFLEDSKKGMSLDQISIKYAVGKQFVRYQIAKAREEENTVCNLNTENNKQGL